PRRPSAWARQARRGRVRGRGVGLRRHVRGHRTVPDPPGAERRCRPRAALPRRLRGRDEVQPGRRGDPPRAMKRLVGVFALTLLLGFGGLYLATRESVFSPATYAAVDLRPERSEERRV